MFGFQFHQHIHGLLIVRDQLTHIGFHFGLIMAWSMAVTSSKQLFQASPDYFFMRCHTKLQGFSIFERGILIFIMS